MKVTWEAEVIPTKPQKEEEVLLIGMVFGVPKYTIQPNELRTYYVLTHLGRDKRTQWRVERDTIADCKQYAERYTR